MRAARSYCVLLVLATVGVVADDPPPASPHNPTNITRMNADLRHVPVGSAGVVYLNLAHNRIRSLENFAFAERRYRDVRTLYVFRNALAVVGVDAFRGLPALATVDLSDNRLTTLASDTFAGNAHLVELVLANNRILLDERAFVRAPTLRTLSLAGNRITDVHDATFADLVNLRRLLLADNPLVRLSPACFRGLHRLRYLSLADTAVHRLNAGMFFSLPRFVHVARTPFADAFHPPLTHLTNHSFAELAQFDDAID